jgi:hypothetical protein
MRKMLEFPVAELNCLVAYNPATGILIWRPRGTKPSPFNSQFAHQEAGYTDTRGYTCVVIKGVHYLAHRVAYAIAYGEWPTGDIDHINGIRNDNRLENLRCVDHRENCKNRRISKNNTSGFSGIRKMPHRRKCWAADIRVDGRRVYLGYYEHLEEAVAARKVAEKNYGFHENHGLNRQPA